MNNSRRTDPLAAAVAVILAGAPVAAAHAQASLETYREDFSGPSGSPPSSATRRTVFDMDIPRLQAIQQGIQALRDELNNHPHPDHQHPPHVHIDDNLIVGGISSDGGQDPSVTGYAANGSTLSLSPQDLASGSTVIGGTTYYSSQQAADSAGGDSSGDGY